ncbi:hypothetical protein AAC387_Pa07g2296 [Persea americana]
MSPWKELVIYDAGDTWEQDGEERKILRVLRERELEGYGCGVGEKGVNEGRIFMCGEDGGNDGVVVEKVGKMEERDGVSV